MLMDPGESQEGLRMTPHNTVYYLSFEPEYPLGTPTPP